MTFDPRIITLVAFAVLSGTVMTWSQGLYERLHRDGSATTGRNKGETVARLLLGVVVMPLVGGYADMILWNMIAPQFGLPQIDLVTAIALDWLIKSLTRGGPIAVRIQEPSIHMNRWEGGGGMK